MVHLNGVEGDVSAKSFIRLDHCAVTFRSIVGDIDIIFDISNDIDNTVNNDNYNFDDENDETLSFYPSNIEIEESLNTFHTLSLFSTYGDSENGDVTKQGKIAELKTKCCW